MPFLMPLHFHQTMHYPQHKYQNSSLCFLKHSVRIAVQSPFCCSYKLQHLLDSYYRPQSHLFYHMANQMKMVDFIFLISYTSLEIPGIFTQKQTLNQIMFVH